MRLESIRLTNFQSFADSGMVPLRSLSVFVGGNNSGKSTFINAVRLMQVGLGPESGPLVRLANGEAVVRLEVSSIPAILRVDPDQTMGAYQLNVGSGGGISLHQFPPGAQGSAQNQFTNTLPDAQILPLLADRAGRDFEEQVNAQTASSVRSESTNLPALVSRLIGARGARSRRFSDACEAILGFQIALVPSRNGQLPGLRTDHGDIPLSVMGSGVLSITRMLAYLCDATQKIIIIEEPENDLHPSALKHLLGLIVEAARENQILVTTHSQIVVNALGSQPESIIYRVGMSLDDHGVPSSSVVECDSPADRIRLLRELGNELTDVGLHAGFLILEESSAESVIERLVAWFTPKLVGRLRTIAAGGVNDVEVRLSDVLRMFVFVHLEQAYTGRAWVLVDGDQPGRSVIDGLRAKFTTWDPAHFTALARDDFEEYYPARFKAAVDAIRHESDRNIRRKLKDELRKEVLRWMDEEPEAARIEFEPAAKEVIAFLKTIESVLAKVD